MNVTFESNKPTGDIFFRGNILITSKLNNTDIVVIVMVTSERVVTAIHSPERNCITHAGTNRSRGYAVHRGRRSHSPSSPANLHWRHEMQFTLINNSKLAPFGRGDLAIMESEGITRIVLVESLEGETFTGTVVYYDSTTMDTEYPVGTYTEGWMRSLYQPFTGKLTIDI